MQSDENGGTASTSENNDAVCELQETSRSKAKAPGKKCSQKNEFQSHILDILEQDNTIHVEEEDAINTIFSGIAKRVKKSLPEDEAFTLIHNIQGTVNEHIKN